ncbi:hypothetical protein CDAR_461511 [Caerostris darwini]|uniref:Uncharacterized protein n=1 Tax=Caerostris darwini TaxID=1538125 RepID=A0AAV4M6X3_9ARAC|nr:hypothetical protein CDAR_461511 [Caerostris darwini]
MSCETKQTLSWLQHQSDSICKRKWKSYNSKDVDVIESSICEWKKNEITIINMKSISNNLDGTEDDYLFMDQSNSVGEDETEFDVVLEDITEDEYDDVFLLSNNESSCSATGAIKYEVPTWRYTMRNAHRQWIRTFVLLSYIQT